MKNIEIIGKIKLEALNSENYFQSLLEQAYITELLSQSQIEKIQFDCLALLAKKTRQFNGGDSSSIPTEKAQSIFASINFTVGIALKDCPSPDVAVEAIQSIGIEAIFSKGRKRIDMLLQQAKLCHKALAYHLLQSKNVFYSSTAVEGIKGFFKLYDTEFAAHEIHITADYPVYNKALSLLGIEFIMQYLRQLLNENMFCTLFSKEDIHGLLSGYNEQYENLLFNIYEPVLAAALGCVIANVPANTLEITTPIQAFLYQHFKEKHNTEIEQILCTACIQLSKSFAFSDSLTHYVKQSLHRLATNIEFAVKAGTVNQIFIVPENTQSHAKLVITYGEKMDDEEYRTILNMFMHCKSIPEKISIIKSKINSIADLEDLLLDAELSENDIIIILRSLKPAEFAALTKKYMPLYEMSYTELRDCEKILCQGLNTVAAALPQQQKALLDKAVNALELHEFE